MNDSLLKTAHWFNADQLTHKEMRFGTNYSIKKKKTLMIFHRYNTIERIDKF